MKIINTTCPIIAYKVPNHAELKHKIITAIESMGVHSLIEPANDQRISNTDWHLSPEYARPYFYAIQELLPLVTANIKNVFHIGAEMSMSNYWFQEYKKDDFHGWHVHQGAMFSNVYYVSLPNGASYTTFKVNGYEFQVPIEEGYVLTFPSFYLHSSKKHEADESKLVLVFNM